MDLQKDIKKLVTYGLDKKLIMPEDEIYTINQYLELFRLDEYEDPDIEGEEIILPEILDRLTDTAYDRYIIKSDDIVTRDLFDTKLMGILTPKPSQVIKEFRTYYEESPKKATEFFYEFSQDTDYIRRYRIKRDVKWVTKTPYGDLDITINLSKPEKDPKAIAAAKLAPPERLPQVPALRGERGLCRPDEPSRPREPPHHPADHQRQCVEFPVQPLCLLQ